MKLVKNTLRLVLVACLFALALTSPQVTAQEPSTTTSIEGQFFDAIKKGDSAKTTSLLKQQPSLARATYQKGITPVLLAVYTKHPDLAETLLTNSSIEPNIFEAAATGHIDRVRTLLKKDPNLTRAWSPDGWTALHLNFNNLEIAKLLIDGGADLNANSRNKLDATPLQGAAANNWIDLAKLYLSRGANVNCRSEGGGTPLHEAAGNGFVEFARLLLENGANPNQRDDTGKTPLTISLETKQSKIADLLREHGGTE